MKITKQEVDKLRPDPNRPQQIYYDIKLKGFGVRVTASGIISFFVEKRVNGKLRRITIGRYGDLTVEQARVEAQKLLGLMARGIDPVIERREVQARSKTLQDVFNDYLRARKNLKASTIQDYHRLTRETLSDWLNKPITNITKDMIAKRHEKRGERSHARANGAMRLLRALFNFARGEYEDAKGNALILENPVSRLSHTRAWYRIERRRSVIKAHQLKPWFEAVMSLESDHSAHKPEIIRDYLLLLLFTGLRRNEGAKLKVSDVDLQDKTLTLIDTKNNRPHTLPLSNFLFELLKRRIENTPNEYVFPGAGKTGYIIEPRKQMDKVIARSGVNYTLHSLRRSFASIANNLDIPAYAVKRLINHKDKADVTAGYIIIDTEDLRKPMQKITDFILNVTQKDYQHGSAIQSNFEL